MRVTKTWATRLDRSRVLGRRIGVAALAALALFGAAAGVKVFLAPERPDIAAIAQRVNNQQSQVGAFAADLVMSWLTAATTCDRDAGQLAAAPGGSCSDHDRAALQRFITLSDNNFRLPQTPAAVITVPQVVSVIDTGTVGEAQLFTAVVAVNERPYVSAQPTRAFYRVPVVMWRYQPRAIALPARVNGPGPGADVKLGYRQPLGTDSPLYAVLAGFAKTYLTATSGLDRYVVAGTPLAAVGGYQSAILTSATAAENIPDPAGPGTRIHVLAAVVAQTSQFATVNLVYPLTVENSGGTWMVSALDLMPEIAEAEPNPLTTSTPS